MYAKYVNNMAHYATDEELEWMAKYGKRLSDEDQVVMLGAGPGVLLLALKEHNKSLKATVIDHIRTEYTIAYLSDMGALDNVHSIVAESHEIGETWDGGLIKLLIVDTDHTERTLRKEINAWIDHVDKENGMIFFHDYDAKGTWFERQEQYPYVKEVCDEKMPKLGWKKIDRVGTAAIYQHESAAEKTKLQSTKTSAKMTHKDVKK